jgi:hypothetical protein
MDQSTQSFPEFSLSRLLTTVFEPEPGERICILIDLPDPRRVAGFEFLNDAMLTVQRQAHDVFYQGLKNGVLAELGLQGGEFFAYEITGGSNLDLPDAAWTPEGRELSLTRDVYPNFDIILCISTYSATAPGVICAGGVPSQTAFSFIIAEKGRSSISCQDDCIRTF